MDKFREFQGRDLDECITQAIKWFDASREELELEILQDAKSGIFGIVGARKAKIRARRARVAETVRDILDRAQADPGADAAGIVTDSAQDQAAKRQSGRQGAKNRPPRQSQVPRENDPPANPAPPVSAKRGESQPEPGQALDFARDNDELEDDASGPVNVDAAAFAKAAADIVGKLVNPIAGREVELTIDFNASRPRVKVEWEGDAGLLIGRDGQTLAALQYMASRLLSRALGTPLRIQLDIGEYRSRQEDKLRELAHALAERVRQTGKPASTRPLSSYHRRVVHLCLQEEPDIHTRSAGDGMMKRVVILPGRP